MYAIFIQNAVILNKHVTSFHLKEDEFMILLLHRNIKKHYFISQGTVSIPYYYFRK